MAEIPQLLENAWENFVEFYDSRCLSLGGGGQLVCWNEIDVMGHLMRFLFEEFTNKQVNNIEIHLNCSLKPKNYETNKNKDFISSLKLLQTVFGRRIEVDMVLVKDDEDYYGPFELCLEAKHFHYFPWRKPEELIIEDIERLQAYKNFKIAKSTALIVLDDCLYHKYPDTSDKIEEILNQYENEISILYHIAP